MGRPKKAGRELGSIADCTAAMGELLTAICEIRVLKAEQDLAVAAAGQKFEGRLDDAWARRGGLEAALEAYYYGHVKDIEAAGRKSLQLVNGVMGRRDNPAALKPLNRKWTWAAILQAVTTGLPACVRARAPELDREKLKTLPAEALRDHGMKVESGETFYIEPVRLPADGAK